jgi:hypothetical protein
MPKKKIRPINYIIMAVMLGVLGMLSILPSMVADTIFSLAPILFFSIFTILVITYLKYHDRFPAEISKEGFLYTILIILCCTLISSSALLVSAESFYMDNTLDGMSMLRISMILGAPVGVITWVWLSKQIGIKHIVFLKTFLISFALYFATMVSLINRESADQENISMAADVVNKEKNSGSIATYLLNVEPLPYIYIPYEEDVERLSIPKVLWDPMYPNASINLNIRKGYFGYYYIDSINEQHLL